MSKYPAFLLTIFTLVLTVPCVSAMELPQPAEKFKEGFTSIVSSPKQIIVQPITQMDEGENKVLGFAKGVAEAPVHILQKGGSGVVDLVTFPVKDEDQYDPVAGKTKFQEGVMRIAKSPMQFINKPMESVEIEEGAGKFLGLFKGMAQAPFYFLQELGDGFVTTLTFSVEESEE